MLKLSLLMPRRTAALALSRQSQNGFAQPLPPGANLLKVEAVETQPGFKIHLSSRPFSLRWQETRCDARQETLAMGQQTQGEPEDWQDVTCMGRGSFYQLRTGKMRLQHYCSGNKLKNPERDMRNICSAHSPAKSVNRIVDSSKAVTKCIGNILMETSITGCCGGFL